MMPFQYQPLLSNGLTYCCSNCNTDNRQHDNSRNSQVTRAPFIGFANFGKLMHLAFSGA
ncbi:protein of unknown function [Rhodovastum atsumiense]|nr:protein of unknown function [Rhodovastum atsumiense]